MSATAGSNAFLTVQVATSSNIWLAPGGDATAAMQITKGSGTYDGTLGVSLAPDGRVVYVSTASGGGDLWIANSDGTGQKQLTDTGANYVPMVSSDGSHIVFASERTGVRQVWTSGIDGGNLRQLTNGNGSMYPVYSPDGRWIVYASENRIWKMPADGGEPVRLTDKLTGRPSVSPDGRLIACQYSTRASWELAIYPFEGGQPLKVFDVPRGFDTVASPRWSSDGREVQFV